MKKLQMIAVLILALLFVSACLPEDEDEEEFLNDDRTDTAPDENSDTTDDTLPDGQQNTEPTNPTNEPTEPTEPTNSTEPSQLLSRRMILTLRQQTTMTRRFRTTIRKNLHPMMTFSRQRTMIRKF